MTSQINLFNDRLRQQLETLELEYQRWNNCKQDYDALEALLTTLPETTTKTAMIPMGKLAFMPGKLIHTNEILVLLGDQYYVERSAKQAIEILGRRKEHVNTNLNLVEAEINSVKAKSKALVDTGILSEAQFNEEGLPIMEIREEWPEEEGKVLQKVQTKVEEKTPSSTLPPSVQRARDMMNSQPAKDSGDENKALFDMLKELEEEEEEEEEKEKPRGQGKPWLRGLNEESDKEAESDNEDDERYDMELSENIFDKFDEENDEEFPLDGIVDQDDFTYHDQETQEEVYEKSTPSVLTKPKHKKIEPEIELEAKELKPAVQQKVAESVPPTDESIQQEKTPKKKMSKFKLMKQQERRKDAPVTKEEKRKPVKEEPVKEEPVKKEVKEEPVKKEVKEEIKEEPVKEEVKKAKDEKESTQEKELPKKKVSKFKLMKQQERKQDTQKPSVESSIKEVKEEQPSDEEKEVRKAVRKVTWDAHATVIEHENHDAPSVLSKVSSYSEPVIRQTQEDDYPSLDDDDYGTQTVDLNELIRLARENQEPFYRPADGSMIPIPKQMEEEQQQQQGGIIIAKKSKLDNKIMKGSVMERESVSVDVDKLEEDMDLKEITSRYHAKRQQILAATGSLSFESKPEIEVFDEELPLPSKQLQEEEEEEEIPKKVSSSVSISTNDFNAVNAIK
ncbi:hypothetical protein RO3G_04771 [Rhizopus delemar RA 99-880]|uniref:DUF3835 domain-containing protein n=1 Tax=Rhizopus delemar (strain RA 99-880 / ATCC MYA-4621 / FGSC 9543 / NRRL 43880) TaxID=246409 RepID=I1BV36_RHIO9|nr:hypothetical protein RO3G_04771 [Rhizopus delemar RA 99-880]|eukprot:EIE80066.1 hypothetical protein RO3G_04771 [Rhizopus delemar RA 99-880]